MLHANLLLNLANFFENNAFNKHENTNYITIKNPNNDHKILVPRNLFETYCHFIDIINLSEEKSITTVTVPFTFHHQAGEYFVCCLTLGKLGSFFVNNEPDYEEFKRLMIYFQVTFS